MSELSGGVMLTENALRCVAQSIEMFYKKKAQNRDWCITTVRNAADQFEKMREEISTLRTQPENNPLTLDEMNALDHEPIYVLHTGGKWTMNGWHIATASSYQNHGRCDLEIDNGNTTIDTQNYGITWLAYLHKPKEEHHEAD